MRNGRGRSLDDDKKVVFCFGSGREKVLIPKQTCWKYKLINILMCLWAKRGIWSSTAFASSTPGVASGFYQIQKIGMNDSIGE